MLPSKAFYLIRHGQTIANVTQTSAGGGLDSPLTDEGQEQARSLANLIHQLEIKPSKIYHSSMSRARDTASLINEKLGLAMHEADDLKEHLLGEWEGKPWDDVMPKIIANERPEGGENKDDFAHRVKNIISNILHGHEDEQPAMLVAHGGTFHSILHMYDHNQHIMINN